MDTRIRWSGRPAICAVLSTLSALLSCLLAILLWWLPNLPVAVPPIPDGKIASVSFAPFRDGQSPLTSTLPSASQIEEDLNLIARQARAIRTYTSREGLEVVPAIAKRLNLQLLAGAWIGPVPATNAAEVEALVRAANAYPDVIPRVIVGNEVLLRRDLPQDQLIAHIRNVRSRIRQPVGYADVWENFLRFPEIVDEVDYLVIHILAYWEDIPAGVNKVASHIRWALGQIHQRFPGKPVMIGETGWPTEGRSRGPAVPSRVNKAKFLSQFIDLAEKEGFDYNIIEAFDQSWKERLEGTVGARWGLITSDRHYKFTLNSPIAEDPDWPFKSLLSIITAIFIFITTRLKMKKNFQTMPDIFLSQIFAAALIASAFTSWSQSFLASQKFFASILFLVQLTIAFTAMRSIATRPAPWVTDGKVDQEPVGFSSTLGRLGLWVIALWSLWVALALVINGRYRDFPNYDLLLPALVIITLGALRWHDKRVSWAVAFDLSHLFGGTPPAAASSMWPGWWAGARRVPGTATLVVGILTGAIGVTVREVWLQGLDLDAILRVTREAGFAIIASNGINQEALISVFLLLIITLPFLARWRLAGTRNEQDDGSTPTPKTGTRGWDSR